MIASGAAPRLEEMILYVQHCGKYVLVGAKHQQRWLTSPHSESAFGEIATEPMEHSLHLCYKFAMRKTIERWLLFKYVGLEFTPLSKPFNTKEQAEKARMKYPERQRKTIGLGMIRVKS